MGSEGCFYRAPKNASRLKGYKVETIDTTGAGDSFLGGALYKILEKKKAINNLDEADMKEIITFANSVGALTTTKKGAISIMPTLKEVQNLISR